MINNNSDYSNYDGFNNISKAKNHVITTKSINQVGVCDLNSNCSQIELDLSEIKNNKFNTDSITINPIQSNKLVSNNNNLYLETSIINQNNIEKFSNSNNFNYDNIIIGILIFLIVIYLVKSRKNK